jgi:hypothetical protein
MLTQDQRDFYTRWLQKADNINNGDIASLIDKYITLFIGYNFLYNIVPVKKAQETGNQREEVRDRAGATTFTINFIGAEAISKYLTDHGLDAQVEGLANAMPHFNIDLNKGTPQPKRDKALVKGLRSADADTKILALMKTLYSIRCNIVHGEKGLHQYQEMLLLPAIQLLRALVPLVYNRVNT